MSEETKRKLALIISPVVLAGLFGIAIYNEAGRYIPRENKVQHGYAIPSKLEIRLQDLDGDGQKETIIKYDNKPYLLRIDDSGKPTIQSYEIKPSEVIIKSK